MKILLGDEVSGDIFPNWKADSINNDPKHICSDSVLKEYDKRNLTGRYTRKIDSLKRSGFLYARPTAQRFKDKQISPGEFNILLKIKALFEKHKTNYYVAITPLYDQYKFNPSDKEILTRIFGSNLHDFSGINEFTNDEYNYPDRTHFLNDISKSILDSMISDPLQHNPEEMIFIRRKDNNYH